MNIEIGKKIYKLRKSKDMTQEKLASELGVSVAAVSKWETGNSLPDILMLCSIADFFNVSTDELLGRDKNKKKVIIVDDVEFIRNSLKAILAGNGCEIVGEAAEGNELLDILKRKKADLIFLDINMPGMNGMTALQNVMKAYPNAKVIMCSAVADKEVIDSAIELGAAAYITKPFLPDKIIEKVNII
ncbi:response regulator [Clostridium swellfunianum]|uniref:response regulator n=1 Tax=Clostridium swellfunianum TaxID=1367462 RepID=UPI00202F149D|nr:response regulator [Clostridium swellfunianum]MCM0650276.1 response regulator [Clostridium swellfunianum]